MNKQEEFQVVVDEIANMVVNQTIASNMKHSAPLIRKAISLFFEIDQSLNHEPFSVNYKLSSGETIKVPALGAFMSIVEMALDIQRLLFNNTLVDAYVLEYYNTVKKMQV